LTSNTIASGVRVNEPRFQNKRFQVSIDLSHDSWLLLIDFLNLKVFWKMDNLGSIEAQRAVHVSLHLFRVDSHKQIWIIDIPKNMVGCS